MNSQVQLYAISLEVGFNDIQNNQGRGKYYKPTPKSKAGANDLIFFGYQDKPNSINTIIVLLNIVAKSLDHN